MSESTTEDTTERFLVKNQAKCLVCGDTIVSRDRHDFVTCSCGALSVDGGQDYARRLFKESAQWEEMSTYSDVRPIREDGHRLEHSDVILQNTHSVGACYSEHCTIHAMSDHVLRGCAQSWYGGMMWRRCEHDAYHPDPDELLSESVVREHDCCTNACCAGAYADVCEPVGAGS
jgi:hypothetical protein